MVNEGNFLEPRGQRRTCIGRNIGFIVQIMPKKEFEEVKSQKNNEQEK